MVMLSPFSRPVYVMLKPVGGRCNLRCDYCYYLDKGSSGRMSEGTLELFVRQYMESQMGRDVLFTWHGGEPLLMPLSFYRRAVSLQSVYARGRHVDNCIQTNGTLLTEDWCRFLADEGWLVGLSLDGPEDMHDRYRKGRDGGGSFGAVMRAVELLERFGVEWNAMATVNAYNVSEPVRFYRFFKSIGCHYIQLSPVVERCIDDTNIYLDKDIFTQSGKNRLASVVESGLLTAESVTAEDWGRFLCEVFDEWWAGDVGEYYVTLFDAVLAGWCGVQPGLCMLGGECGHVGVLEHDGTLYSCDHFVFPGYRLGNIHRQTITEMMLSERQLSFGRTKWAGLPSECRACAYLRLCHGECPKNRFALSGSGERGLNYLCAGYRRFFEHSADAMSEMRSRIDENQ